MIVRTSGETTGKTTTRIVHLDSGAVIETMAPGTTAARACSSRPQISAPRRSAAAGRPS